MPNPRSDVTVTLGEYGSDIAPALIAGQYTVRMVNAGNRPHEMFILTLAPGKMPQDLVTWVEYRSGCVAAPRPAS